MGSRRKSKSEPDLVTYVYRVAYFFKRVSIDRSVKLTITERSRAPSLSKIESGEIPQSRRDEEIAFQSGGERCIYLVGDAASSSTVRDADEDDAKTLKARSMHRCLLADE